MDIFHVTYLRLLWSVLLLSSFAAAVIVALLFLCTHLNGVGESTSLGVGEWGSGRWEVGGGTGPGASAATEGSSDIKQQQTYPHTCTHRHTHTHTHTVMFNLLSWNAIQSVSQSVS